MRWDKITLVEIRKESIKWSIYYYIMSASINLSIQPYLLKVKSIEWKSMMLL
jgi:hypothetical protein